MKWNACLGAVTALIVTSSFVDSAAAQTFTNSSYNDGTDNFTTLIGADREWFQLSDTDGLSPDAALATGTRATDGFRVANLTDMNALLDFFGISNPVTLVSTFSSASLADDGYLNFRQFGITSSSLTAAGWYADGTGGFDRGGVQNNGSGTFLNSNGSGTTPVQREYS